MRRLAWGGTAPLLLLLPSMGYALALGNISVHSALNEPFEADIKLSSVSAGELDSARIKLASRDDFKRAGILHVPVLSDLRFNIIKRRGKDTLEVSSVVPVRDPFLDFLVEVVTSKGRMVRQYTVLIDPPELPVGFRSAPAVATPQVAPRSTGTIRRIPTSPPAPAVAANSRASGAVSPASPSQRSSVSASTSSATSYGPTRRNDTLWDIAKKTRPSRSVSMNQMMMALLRRNPQAFSNSNVNNLKSGQMLAIPQQGEITQLSREQARNAFQQQYRDWKSGVASVPPPKVERQVVSASLRADAARIKAPAAATDDGELVLVAPRDDEQLDAPSSAGLNAGAASDANAETGNSAEQGKLFEELRRQRDLAQEQAYTAAQESRELLRRTDELEGRLVELEKALKLRDANIATMQRRAGEAMEPQPDESVPADSGVEAVDDAQTAQAPEAEKVDAVVPDSVTDPVAPESSPLDIITNNWGRVAAVGGLLGVAGLGVFLTRRRRRNEDDLSTFGDGDVVDMPTVAGGDVITEVNQFLAYGRPQQAEERLKQAIVAEPERIELPIKLLEVYSRTGNKEAFDALASEVFTRLGRNSVSADWQRIAGMGRRLSPNNSLYAPIGGVAAAPVAAAPPPVAAAKPPLPKPPIAAAAASVAVVAAAAPVAPAAASAIEDDGPAFDELEQELRRLELEIGAAVAEEDLLGSESDPVGASSDLAADSSVTAPADDGMDFDLSFDDLDKMDSAGSTASSVDSGVSTAADDDGSLDFDWGTDEDSDDSSADADDDTGLSSALDPEFTASADTDLAFDSADLGDLSEAKVIQGGPAASDDVPDFDDIDAGDVTLSFDDLDAGSATAEPDSDPVVDLDAELEISTEAVASADDILSFDDVAEDSDSLTFDDTPSAEADGSGGSDPGFIDLGDFGGEDLELGGADGGADMEELTTKLDLARAYVDMEDKDSAIDILDEVLKDASGTVRSEAEALRKQLG